MTFDMTALASGHPQDAHLPDRFINCRLRHQLPVPTSHTQQISWTVSLSEQVWDTGTGKKSPGGAGTCDPCESVPLSRSRGDDSLSENLCPKQGPPKLNPKFTPKSRHNVDGWWTSVSTLYMVYRGVSWCTSLVYIFGHLTVQFYACRLVGLWSVWCSSIFPVNGSLPVTGDRRLGSPSLCKEPSP